MGTRATDYIYSVDLTPLGQSLNNFFAFPASSDITAFALSADLTTLYYGFPAPAQGVAGGIAALSVSTGNIPYSQSPITIAQSVSVIYPDSIVVSGTGTGQTLYFKDGGPYYGHASPSVFTTQTVNAVSLSNPTITVLFSTLLLNLPGGLIETNPATAALVAPTGVSSLFFTTSSTVAAVNVVPVPVVIVTQPPSSTAPSSTAVTSAARGSSSVTSPVSSTGTGRILGDPVFVGFLGQRYQIHGMDGATYNLLSQPSLSINAIFVFLDSGSCPVLDGVKATNCWSHPGSYFAAISIQTHVGDHLNIIAGIATTGFHAVRLNGERVKTVKGVEGKGVEVSLQMLSSHSLSLSVDNYCLVVDNSNLFVNLVSIEVVDWQRLASDQPHGLLGQTWKVSQKGRGREVAVPYVVEGDVDDYLIASGAVFGTDFVYNKFVDKSQSTEGGEAGVP